jgi:hypothetical protein
MIFTSKKIETELNFFQTHKKDNFAKAPQNLFILTKYNAVVNIKTARTLAHNPPIDGLFEMRNSNNGH